MFKTTAARCLDRTAIRRMAEEAGCAPSLLQDPASSLDWLYVFAESIEDRVREDVGGAVDEALAAGIAIAMELKG